MICPVIPIPNAAQISPARLPPASQIDVRPTVAISNTTKKMINADAFAKMKDGVIVLNFARDLLVDDGALEAAIAAGKVLPPVVIFLLFL